MPQYLQVLALNNHQILQRCFFKDKMILIILTVFYAIPFCKFYAIYLHFISAKIWITLHLKGQ